jgi:hypothetical protein
MLTWDNLCFLGLNENNLKQPKIPRLAKATLGWPKQTQVKFHLINIKLN